MANRRTITTFSLSLLDLLFCAFGGVVVIAVIFAAIIKEEKASPLPEVVHISASIANHTDEEDSASTVPDRNNVFTITFTDSAQHSGNGFLDYDAFLNVQENSEAFKKHRAQSYFTIVKELGNQRAFLTRTVDADSVYYTGVKLFIAENDYNDLYDINDTFKLSFTLFFPGFQPVRLDTVINKGVIDMLRPYSSGVFLKIDMSQNPPIVELL